MEYEGAKAIFMLEEALPANEKVYLIENETVTPFEAAETDKPQGVYLSCGIYREGQSVARLYFCISA